MRILILIVVACALSAAFTDEDVLIQDDEFQIKPIAPLPNIPPVNNTDCTQAYLCDTKDNCKWVMICK